MVWCVPPVSPGSGLAFAEPRHVRRAHVQAQPPEPERVAEDASVVDGGIGTDLGDQVGVDEGGVEDVATPPRHGEAHALPRVPGRGRGEVLGDLSGGVRAQRYGAADRAKAAVLVVAAEDEELRAGEEILAVLLQKVEGGEGGRPLHGEGQGAAGAGGGTALQGLERQPARLGVPDDQFAVEEQAGWQLRLGGRHQVRPPVLHQRPATGLHHHRATRPGRGEDERPVTVLLQTLGVSRDAVRASHPSLRYW